MLMLQHLGSHSKTDREGVEECLCWAPFHSNPVKLHVRCNNDQALLVLYGSMMPQHIASRFILCLLTLH